MTNEEYFKFFKNLFDIWITDTKKVKLNQIVEIYEEFLKSLDPSVNFKKCSCSGNCFECFISLDINGRLYSCNRTYNNNDCYYGNIKDLNSIEILNEKMKQMSMKRKRIIENSKCKKCDLFMECNGGCPANAYIIHNNINYSDDYFCEAKIKIKKYIKERIIELNLLNEYKEGLIEKKSEI